MRIVWTQAARGDVIAVWTHIASDNADAAEALCARIIDAVERLSAHPRMGRPGRLTGTRELAISGTPYLVVYAAEATEVVILRLLHGAMNWPRPRQP